MSWVNDPHELALLPELEKSDVSFEEAPDPQQEFWEEAGDSVFSGYDAAYHQEIIAHRRVCVFDYNGNHVQMSESCPHFDAVDEQGPKVSAGWTVQNNRR